MTQTRINVRTAVNASKIRRETRAGRDVVIVPSATLPDDIVMNGIRYPAAEIEKSYLSLEGTPAPLGHPNIDGAFVSASDPKGMVRGFVGAWNENVRRENGRVLIDKVIDVEFASQLEGGKAVLNAIQKGEPIHTSTGLYAILTPLANDDTASREASDIVFDHDAILIGEDGAATPSQGVGMLVNGKQVEVVNSTLEQDAEDNVQWAVDSLARALAQKEQVPLLERIKSSILGIIRGGLTEGDEPQGTAVNMEKQEMAVTDEQFKGLEAKVDGLDKVIADAVANALKAALDPIKEQTEALANAAKAKEEAELTDLRAQIVNANLMDEDAAGELSLKTARALANKAAPKTAHGIFNGFNGVGTEDAPTYDLPE